MRITIYIKHSSLIFYFLFTHFWFTFPLLLCLVQGGPDLDHTVHLSSDIYIYCAVLVPQLCLTYDPMDCSPPDPLSVEFSRQEYWSGLTFPFPWDLLNPRIEPQSPALWVDSLPSERIYTYIYMYVCLCIYMYVYIYIYIYIYICTHTSFLIIP